MVIMFAFNILAHYLLFKSLTLKQKEQKTDMKKLFKRNTLYINIGILFIGLIAIFIVIPIFI